MSDKMTFNEFVNTVQENIRDYLPEEYRDAVITTAAVQKLKDSYLGMTVKLDGQSIVPQINMDKHYDAFLQGASGLKGLDDTLRLIARQVQEQPELETTWLRDYDMVKDHLFLRVSNAEENVDILKDSPSRTADGLALTYHIAVEGPEGLGASVRVSDRMMEMFGITEQQLHADALASAQKLLPPKFMKLSVMMADMMGVDPSVTAPPPGTPDLMLLTNDQAFNGASALFYPEMMDNIAAEVGSDYFVIPSSIHEILILPDDGLTDAQALESIIQDVNASVVDPEEQLANYPYHYDSRDHVFEKAETFQIRMEEREAAAQKEMEAAAKQPEVRAVLTDPAKARDSQRKELSPPADRDLKSRGADGDERRNGGKSERKSVLARLNDKKAQVASQPKKDIPGRSRGAQLG